MGFTSYNAPCTKWSWRNLVCVIHILSCHLRAQLVICNHHLQSLADRQSASDCRCLAKFHIPAKFTLIGLLWILAALRHGSSFTTQNTLCDNDWRSPRSLHSCGFALGGLSVWVSVMVGLPLSENWVPVLEVSGFIKGTNRTMKEWYIFSPKMIRCIGFGVSRSLPSMFSVSLHWHVYGSPIKKIVNGVQFYS